MSRVIRIDDLYINDIKFTAEILVDKPEIRGWRVVRVLRWDWNDMCTGAYSDLTCGSRYNPLILSDLIQERVEHMDQHIFDDMTKTKLPSMLEGLFERRELLASAVANHS